MTAESALDARREQVWRPSADLAIVDDGDAIYVLDLARLAEDGVPRSIAGTGAALWRRLDGVTLGDLVAAVAVEFDADPAVIADDVLAFVDELAAIGILVLEGAVSASSDADPSRDADLSPEADPLSDESA